jgi:hypothetical protein
MLAAQEETLYERMAGNVLDWNDSSVYVGILVTVLLYRSSEKHSNEPSQYLPSFSQLRSTKETILRPAFEPMLLSPAPPNAADFGNPHYARVYQ